MQKRSRTGGEEGLGTRLGLPNSTQLTASERLVLFELDYPNDPSTVLEVEATSMNAGREGGGRGSWEGPFSK